MYNFRDVTAASGPGEAFLPPEALKLNGSYLETLIGGYRTLQVSGREALAPEVATYETGLRDGVKLKYKRYPARTITVKYQLIAPTDTAFRQAYNALGALLDVTDAQLIFKDEPDKYFIGTPSGLGAGEPGTNVRTRSNTPRKNLTSGRTGPATRRPSITRGPIRRTPFWRRHLRRNRSRRR